MIFQNQAGEQVIDLSDNSAAADIESKDDQSEDPVRDLTTEEMCCGLESLKRRRKWLISNLANIDRLANIVS